MPKIPAIPWVYQATTARGLRVAEQIAAWEVEQLTVKRPRNRVIDLRKPEIPDVTDAVEIERLRKTDRQKQLQREWQSKKRAALQAAIAAREAGPK